MEEVNFKRGNGNQDSDEELLKAQALVWKHMFNFIHTMSLKCAIELAIPDTIHNHGKPMTLPELVANLPIHPSKALQLHRLMRILSHSGFFALQELGPDQKGYVLTHASHLLLKDNPFSVAPLFLFNRNVSVTKPWEHLTTWFRNEDLTPFETANGLSFWEYVTQQPEISSLFNKSMTRDTKLVLSIIADKQRNIFEGVNTLVDVGGNIGTMARGIADAFPNMECIVFDLPNIVAGLEGIKNLKFVGGDMFESIPPANAILLKWILHDWGDEECVKIMEQCKKAISSNGREGGKVFIIDTVIKDHDNEHNEYMEAQLLFDMEMMALFNGKERTEQELANLFSLAGFKDYKVTQILGARSLIEVYP